MILDESFELVVVVMVVDFGFESCGLVAIVVVVVDFGCESCGFDAGSG